MTEESVEEIASLAYELRRHFADDQRTLQGVLGSRWRNYARAAAQRLETEAAATIAAFPPSASGSSEPADSGAAVPKGAKPCATSSTWSARF